MVDRRTYLERLGAVSTIAVLAGCVEGGDDSEDDSGGNNDSASSDGAAGTGAGDSEESDSDGESDGDSESDEDEDSNEDGEGEEDEDSDEDSESGEDEDSDGEQPPQRVEEYLADTPNYDGELADLRGQQRVEITVGAGSQGLQFDPPAVAVDPGTELVWEWSGNGGAHNVAAEEPPEAFHSGEPTDEEGASYSVTVASDGTFLYFCEPHRGLDMLGAVVVGEGGEGRPEAVTGEDEQDSEPQYSQEPNVEDAIRYLEDHEARIFDGEVADRRGEAEVSVAVGAGEGFAFDPPLVRVDAGTELVWEWTGNGGAHNVYAAEPSASSFESEVTDESDHTFRQVFDQPGNYYYYCRPHQAIGMYGVVVVE